MPGWTPRGFGAIAALRVDSALEIPTRIIALSVSARFIQPAFKYPRVVSFFAWTLCRERLEVFTMPKKAASTPSATPTLKKSASAGGQKTLLGFFQKTPSTSSPAAPPARSAAAATPAPVKSRPKTGSTTSGSTLTPVPSSDALEPEDEDIQPKASLPSKSLPSPVSADGDQTNGIVELTSRGTPSRKVSCTQIYTPLTLDSRLHRSRQRRLTTLSLTARVLTEMMCSNPRRPPPNHVPRSADASLIVTQRMSTSRRTMWSMKTVAIPTILILREVVGLIHPPQISTISLLQTTPKTKYVVLLSASGRSRRLRELHPPTLLLLPMKISISSRMTTAWIFLIAPLLPSNGHTTPRTHNHYNSDQRIFLQKNRLE